MLVSSYISFRRWNNCFLVLGEIGVVHWFPHIFDLDIIDEGPLIALTSLWVLNFGIVCFCRAAFMPGPNNMRAVRGISSLKYAAVTKKSWVAVLIFHGLIVEVNVNYLGAHPQLWHTFKHLLNLTDRCLFSLRTLMVITWQISCTSRLTRRWSGKM